MADEELVTSATETPKRKLEDLELNTTADPVIESDPTPDPDSATDGAENGGVDESDAKRQRLESNGDNVDEPVSAVEQNGHQEEGKEDEKEEDPEEDPKEETETVDNSTVVVEGQEAEKEPLAIVTEEQSVDEMEKMEDVSNEDACVTKTDVEEVKQDVDEAKQDVEQTETGVGTHSDGVVKEGDVPVSVADMEPGSENQVLSRRIEVPNDKVGVLIGKAGDTIRSLQDNSGAKIQIVRDADADPQASTRPIELVGTALNINRAEKLIKDVIAEADVGGSPSLVARGFGYTSAGASGEQVEIQVPIEKVGLIIGKGGETIRNLQTRSGARIQLIQVNPSDGNSPGERTVRITGHKKQIDNARELIRDVMNQTVRPSPLSGVHNQHGYRPRGQSSPQWGPRGPHPQFSGYNNYPQRGPYPSHGSQYPPQYGNYHPQQGPRGNFGPNWEQRPPTSSMHGPSPQGNYNYGQQQGPDYGNQPPYAQQPPPAQPYGHQGYNEVKYDHHASSQPYGQMASQPTPYAQGGPHPGYGQQDQYGKPPMYGQPPHSQPYVQQPRPTSQPGEVAYQGPGLSTQPPYAQNPPPQQQLYPHAPTGPIQQSYPPPQVGQPVVPGYNQPQQGAAYPQQQPAGGYGSYPTAAQYGYPEQQTAAANTAYGYQDPNTTYGAAAQGTYPAPAAGQAGYGQPAAGQGPAPTYDQSGGYGSAPVAAAAPTNVSSLPAVYLQYDATGQMYGSHR